MGSRQIEGGHLGHWHACVSTQLINLKVPGYTHMAMIPNTITAFTWNKLATPNAIQRITQRRPFLEGVSTTSYSEP
jgi:hypothetical protein